MRAFRNVLRRNEFQASKRPAGSAKKAQKLREILFCAEDV